MKTNISKLTIPFNDLEQIKIKNQLSTGSHSSIFLTKTPEYVVKFINIDDPKNLSYNKNEQYAFLHLNKHPNVSSIFSYKELMIKDKRHGCYLMENCSAGSLGEVVSSLQKSLSESLILEIIFQIASGLSFLHNFKPPICYRELTLEKILIGLDGKLKISDFGHICTSQIFEINDTNRLSLQNDIDAVNEKYRAPELCDLYSQLPITHSSDIWALGCVLYLICYKKFPFEGKLAIINNHYPVPKQPQYSEKIINLLKKIFVTKPSERITADEIVSYIKNENMGSIFGEFSFNKNVIQGKKQEMLYGNQTISVEKKEKHAKPKFMDLMNKHFKRLTTKSAGWLLSAVEESEEGPKQKYVRYLIIKAWNNKEKIVKFYKFLQNIVKKNIDNCVIILKSLIVLHNYFKKGPPEALNIRNKEGNPADIIKEIEEFWKKVSENKLQTTKDKKRTPYISSIIYKFSQILTRKLKLCTKYSNYFEGNYAMTPFFKNPKNAPISIAVIEDLLGFLTIMNEFNQNLLNEMTLLRIQMSLVLSVIDEEYCLICLLTHLIYALRKASSFIDGKVKEEKLRMSLNDLMEKFDKNFKSIRIFFLNCKNVKDFEQKESIPVLKLDILDYLNAVKILEKSEGAVKKYNIFQDLNNLKTIFDISLPQCYGNAIKDIKVDEMIGTEEDYKNSPQHQRKTVAHSPDFKISGPTNPDTPATYDFTQFLYSKKSMDEAGLDIKKKSHSSDQKAENLKNETDGKNKEQMIYMGFKINASLSIDEPKLESKESFFLKENLLEIIKKDEESPDVYSEFSHQQINKSVFDIKREQSLEQPLTYIDEAKFHNTADIMERDYVPKENYPDVDPENVISFDNFNKYLNGQRNSTEGRVEAVWDLMTSERESHKENTHKEETHQEDTHQEKIHQEIINVHKEEIHKEETLKEEIHQEETHKEEIHKKDIQKEEDIALKIDNKALEHDKNAEKIIELVQSTDLGNLLTTEELNKIRDAEKQQLLLVGNQTPMEVSYIMVNNNQAKRGAEEAIVKRIESPIKNEEVNINKSPMKSIYEETNSENIISSYSKDESKDENAIKQLLGDDEITNINDFIIDYSTLKFANQIGAGSTSVVFHGYLKNEDVAIKKIKVAEIDESNIIEFKREISALVKLKPHPNLVAFKGVSYSETNVCIITEFCQGGTLFDLLHRKRNIQLSWAQRLNFALDIAKGINYLHTASPPMIHRDLKSLNLLLEYKIDKITDMPNVKIADFGLARNTFSSNVETMTGLMGTFHWMAPEIFENKPYSLKADVYSFGIILWEICARETPYKELKGPHAIMKYVTVDKGRPSLVAVQSDCPTKIIELIQICWDNNLEKRPKMDEVIEVLKKIKLN